METTFVNLTNETLFVRTRDGFLELPPKPLPKAKNSLLERIFETTYGSGIKICRHISSSEDIEMPPIRDNTIYVVSREYAHFLRVCEQTKDRGDFVFPHEVIFDTQSDRQLVLFFDDIKFA